MLASGLLFIGVNTTIKSMGDALPAAEGAFLRYVLGLIFVIPMLKPLRAARLTRVQYKVFFWRGAVHTIGVICWFYAMARIPLADVTAMNYMVPIYITIGAAIFLGEKIAKMRIMAVFVALLGALVILRPGFREISDGHLAMLGNSFFFASSYLLAKRLSGEVSASVVIAMMSITVTIGLFPFAMIGWITPTWSQMGYYLLVAFFATAGHYAMTRAFEVAPVAITQPVTFLSLIWASAIGYVFFGEGVDKWVIIGGAIIIAAVSFITWREALAKRRARVNHA